jgi:hypothetical protein
MILIQFSEEPEQKGMYHGFFVQALLKNKNTVIETTEVSADDCRKNACADPLLLHKYAAG